MKRNASVQRALPVAAALVCFCSATVGPSCSAPAQEAISYAVCHNLTVKMDL